MTSYYSNASLSRVRGFSLVELMVGLTIGFIAVAVIMQSLSVFESHKRTTTAGVDAQENGLLALMAIEADIRKAGAGFNDPMAFSCRKFFSHYQETSGTGVPVVVESFVPVPVLIQDNLAKMAAGATVVDSVTVDRIHVRSGINFAGSQPTQLSKEMAIVAAPAKLELEVDRAYDFRGDPVAATDPPADLILVVSPDFVNCSLMKVSSVDLGLRKLTIANGSSPEYNPTHDYMTEKKWPGFDTTPTYPTTSLVFRVGSSVAGGIRNVAYTVNANNSLVASVSSSGAAAMEEVVSSEIVALQAQYGVSASKESKEINAWMNPIGATWGYDALTANSATATDNRQRIKAVRIAVVARSSQRDGAIVTTACADNNAVNFGPCSWTDDTAANPAPAIDLRASAGDTEWQHYRYRVYQTVIPMRNVLWPDLLP